MSKANEVIGTAAREGPAKPDLRLPVKSGSQNQEEANVSNFRGSSRPGFALTAVFSFVVLLSIWSVLSYGGMVQPAFFLPTPNKVLSSLLHQLLSSEFWHHIWISVFRVSQVSSSLALSRYR